MSLATAMVEDVILRYSQRGMDILKEYMPNDFCHEAAKSLLELPRGYVFVTTGFCVGGAAETDGPLGALCIVKALEVLGFSPILVTDRMCENYFEPQNVQVIYVDIHAELTAYFDLLDQYNPVALIAIERCGRNFHNDYANMRGISISSQTARIDQMFEIAKYRHIFTIGIGDGGNEIGMGNVKEVILEKLSLIPCTVTVDYLIIATVSNWGGYGLVRCLEVLSGQKLFFEEPLLEKYLQYLVSLGCVDGMSKKPQISVDGLPYPMEREIFTSLSTAN